VVSAGAEADFDLGYKVNLDGTRNMLEACRALGTNPRVVFTSSLAAFGGDLPKAVTDETALTPQTSYGAQKSIGEFLIRDYTRLANNARQAEITQELTEIVGGADALAAS
jgi:nucleoside-diphosphate-sugar epimerase